MDQEIYAAQKLSYAELVEDMNEDRKALEQIESPLALFKDQEAQIAEVKKKQDESLKKVKKVYYPMMTFAIIINSLLIIGYYYQDKQIKRNSVRIARQEKLATYADNNLTPELFI